MKYTKAVFVLLIVAIALMCTAEAGKSGYKKRALHKFTSHSKSNSGSGSKGSHASKSRSHGPAGCRPNLDKCDKFSGGKNPRTPVCDVKINKDGSFRKEKVRCVRNDQLAAYLRKRPEDHTGTELGVCDVDDCEGKCQGKGQYCIDLLRCGGEEPAYKCACKPGYSTEKPPPPVEEPLPPPPLEPVEPEPEPPLFRRLLGTTDDATCYRCNFEWHALPVYDSTIFNCGEEPAPQELTASSDCGRAPATVTVSEKIEGDKCGGYRGRETKIFHIVRTYTAVEGVQDSPRVLTHVEKIAVHVDSRRTPGDPAPIWDDATNLELPSVASNLKCGEVNAESVPFATQGISGTDTCSPPVQIVTAQSPYECGTNQILRRYFILDGCGNRSRQVKWQHVSCTDDCVAAPAHPEF